MKTQNIKTAKAKNLLKQILLSTVVILFSFKSYAANYFWVGGTGNWSDFANHWATSSGGTTFHTVVPSPADDVYFDANSFSASGQSANLDIATAYCNNFNWQNTISGTDFISSNPSNMIDVFGSLNVGTRFSFDGIFSFRATTSGNTIFISDTLNCYLDFNNQAGTWIFNSPIVILKEITLQGGTLNTNNFNVTARSFRSDFGTPNRTLLPGSSIFTLICTDQTPFGDWWIDGLLSFNGVNTDINFSFPVNYLSTNGTFRLHTTSSAIYKNLNFNAGLANGGYLTSSFLEIEGNLAAHSLQTNKVQIINMWLDHVFEVDTVLLNDSIQYTSIGMLNLGVPISMDVKYLQGASGALGIFGGNVEKIIHNGDFSVTISSPVPNPVNFIRDVYVSGNFFSSVNSNILTIGKIVIAGGAEIVGHLFVDTMMIGSGKYCTVSSGDTLTVNKQFIASGTPGNYFQFHSGTTGSQGNVNFPLGNVCSDYLMVQDMNAIGSNILAGANSFDLGNNTGWQFAACSNISNVWPGDANYDLTANNNDVLNIGLAYGETGPVRAGASNAWVAQPATDWSSFFLSAVNKKHADCDGNGVVDNNDTTAISLNYGLTHPARLADPNSNLSTSSPQLYLVANPDTVMEGDTVEIDIFLGTQLIPVDSIYGIAFTINFDTALVDTSWMPFDFTGSWMGTPGVDLLPFDHKLFSEGKADVALTRTDHTNASGYGYIGKMGAVIVDNVGTRLTTAPPYVTLPLSISNVTALTATEFYLTISTGAENVEIDTLGITGIHQHINDAPLSVYPNPVHKTLNVFSYWLKGETNCTVELYNVVGEKVISQQVAVSQNRFSIDVSALSQDMYFIKVITAKGTVNKKILVVNK